MIISPITEGYPTKGGNPPSMSFNRENCKELPLQMGQKGKIKTQKQRNGNPREEVNILQSESDGGQPEIVKQVTKPRQVLSSEQQKNEKARRNKIKQVVILRDRK